MDPGQTPRDDEPAPGGDAEDAGSVVSGGHGIPLAGYVPGVDWDSVRERLNSVTVSLRATRESAVLLGDVAQSAAEAFRRIGSQVPGIALTAGAVIFTDRVTGATSPEDEGQTFPDVLRRMTDPSGLPADLLFSEEDAVRLYEQSCVAEDDVRAELGLTVDLDANEELIRSTRAEFPDDPYEYGRRYPHGPMRWTPPPEGEDTPSCPA